MQRILIIGNCGSGKTTVAEEIGRKLNIPVISLDKHYWKPNWKPTKHSNWISVVQELISGTKWIVDGNYCSTLEMRLGACDTVVFLDFSTHICLFRTGMRLLKHFGREGIHSATNCPERFDFGFLWYVATYNKQMRPRVLEKLDLFRDCKNIVRLKDPLSVLKFLQSLDCYASTGIG